MPMGSWRAFLVFQSVCQHPACQCVAQHPSSLGGVPWTVLSQLRSTGTKRDVGSRRAVQDKLAEERLRNPATRADLEKVRTDLLKWKIGIGVALVTFLLAGFGTVIAVMANGFGWPGL